MDDRSIGGGLPLDISDDESPQLFENLDSSGKMDTNETSVVQDNRKGAIPKDYSAMLSSSSPSNTSGSPNISVNPRRKVYPDGSKGPWVVFFRPKEKKLNIPRISKDLTKQFSAVTDIFKVTSDKLRVTVKDRTQANQIVASDFFALEYRVYIPSSEVEIEGVVTEASLTREDFLQADSFGVFKNRAIPNVKILDCTQLHSVSLTGTTKTYSPSDSFRVTFEGSALPDYVTIGKVRLPVRLFVPKVMNCTNCKQLGHTAAYCSNKHRCEQCGEQHAVGPCRTPPKCVYCQETPHALVDCPRYKQQGEKLKRSLQARSTRTLAEILKAAAPSSQATLDSNNTFAVLPDDDQGSDSEVGEGGPFVFRGISRKRSKNIIQKPRKSPRTDSQPTLKTTRDSGNVPKPTPPGFRPSSYNKEFPSLPGSSKTPDIPASQPEIQLNNQPEHAAMFTFSGIVDSIFNVFNVSDPVRNIINLMLPFVKTLLQQLAARWSFLASIISFDG